LDESKNESDQLLAMLILSYIIDKDKAGTSLVFGEGLFAKMIDLLKLIMAGTGDGLKYSLKEVLLGVVNLSVNEGNKVILLHIGMIDILIKIIQVDPKTCKIARVLQGLDESKALSAKILWNLSFNADCLKTIKESVAILKPYATSENKNLSDNITGILFVLTQNSPSKQVSAVPDDAAPGQPGSKNAQHIMLSYQWGSQELVKKIADGLRHAGYRIWIDIEEMRGSTLEAMASAVEESAIVLVCMTRKYKESPNCRSEAEYTNTLRKEFIPLMLESQYKPDGWLGILLGSKLYYEFDSKNFESMMKTLVKVLGNRGKLNSSGNLKDDVFPVDAAPSVVSKGDTIKKWTVKDVGQWLESEDLSNYKQRFAEEKISGRALLKLASFVSKESLPSVLAVLKDLFGVVPCGDLLNFVSALESLN